MLVMAKDRDQARAQTHSTQLQFLPEPQTATSIGTFEELDTASLHKTSPHRFYTHPNGELWVGDAACWLNTLPSESVDLIFADPPYNVKKAEWDPFASQEAYVQWSLAWIEEAARVLKP